MRKFLFSITCLGILAVPFTSSASEVTEGTVIKKESHDFKPKKKKKKRSGGHAGCEAYGRFSPVATK